MSSIKYNFIGTVFSENKDLKGTPIQPLAAKNITGIVELKSEYKEGLRDLDGFSHAILIYHFHMVKPYNLIVTPFMDDKEHGVFSTHAPSRPNAIGISTVRIEKIIDNKIYIKEVDILDGTPLLDIKPYIPEFDSREVNKIGWADKNIIHLADSKDDGRFANSDNK